MIIFADYLKQDIFQKSDMTINSYVFLLRLYKKSKPVEYRLYWKVSQLEHTVSGHHQAGHIQTEPEQICRRGVELTDTKGQSEKKNNFSFR